MTIQDRADAYNVSEWGRKYPASRLSVVREKGGDVLYGTWVIGQDYRNKTAYYGAYPPSYLERAHALFPDVRRDIFGVLHVFAGSLPRDTHQYVTCDSHQDSDYRCDVLTLSKMTDVRWPLVLADPPYTDADATKYGTPMINRGKVTRALAEVTVRGGYLVWLDTVWPMFSKTQWRTCGRIAVIRSTNHRVRLVSIFERVLPDRPPQGSDAP